MNVLPFSLVCCECDAGMNITSWTQAEFEGWTNIQLAADLPMANYIGLCPDCKREIDEADAKLLKQHNENERRERDER